MTRSRRLPAVPTRWLQLLLLCTLLAGSGLLQAQDSASPASPAASSATTHSLQQDISQLRSAADALPEAEQKPVLTLLDDAEQRLADATALQQE